MSNRLAYLLAFISVLFAGAFMSVFSDAPQETPKTEVVRSKYDPPTEPLPTNTPQPTRTPQPTVNPIKAREDQIRSQFSLWDGSHNELVRVVKSVMHNPDSFQHVDTHYRDNGDMLIVTMVYRGTNAFGAVVTNQIKARVDVNTGSIIEIME